MPPRAGLAPAHRYPSATVINPLLFSPTLGSSNASGASLTTGPNYVEWGYAQTTAGSGFAAVVISSATPWDFTQSPLFGLELGGMDADTAGYIAAAPGNRLRILLGTTQGSLGADYYDFNTQLQNVSKEGRFVWSQLRSVGTPVGSPSWSNIRRIEIRIGSDTWPSGHRLRLYSILANLRARPKIVISFDDGNDSVFSDAYPAMLAAGVPGTCYINSNVVGNAGKMTVANLNTLYAQGWDIANHTADHRACCFQIGPAFSQVGGVATVTYDANVWLPTFAPGQTVTISGAEPWEYSGAKTLTGVGAGTFSYAAPSTYPASVGRQSFVPENWYPAVQGSIRQCEAFIAANGWTRGLNHFAYPYGNYDAETIAMLRRMGFLTGRATGGRGHGPFTNCYMVASPSIDFFNIPVFGMSGSTTGAQILAAVDRAIQYNASIFVYGHQVGAGGDIPTAEFQSFITGLKQRINQGLIDAVSISTWYDSASRASGWRATN
jgi:peptidoglycan/xylan/chitin deacetylase (PgdA/CDA1 family)